MTIDVYADMVFLINFGINAVVLWLASALTRSGARLWRVALGGALSGLFYTLLLFSPLRGFLNVFTSFVVLAPGVVTAFGWRGWRGFGVTLGVAYVCAFAMGGLSLMVAHVVPAQDFSTVGMMARAAHPLHLVAASVLAFFGIRFVRRRIVSKALDKQVFRDIWVHIEGKTARLHALVDTGMTLSCPITDAPVVIAEFSSLAELLPEDVREVFESNSQDNLLYATKCFEQAGLQTRLRMIPFKSVGTQTGMLIGIRSDYIEINSNQIKGTVIGICNFALGDGEYTALVNPILSKESTT